jgi:hypothetical protein
VHVIAHHRIADPAAFRARAEGPGPERPVHWRLIAAAPTRDGTACFSLWWADSAEGLQRVLATWAGAAGSVECHEVDDDDALGLPTIDATPAAAVAVLRLAGRPDRAAGRGLTHHAGPPARH